MNPEVQTLGLQLADVALRQTAATIADKVAKIKTSRKQDQVIAELEQMINELVADKAELVRIANAYEQELVAQRISDEDIKYMTGTVAPLLASFLNQSTPADDSSASAQQEIIEKLLSVETITVLQLVGFNFKQAIGEPLTELVSNFIRMAGPSSNKPKGNMPSRKP